MHNVRRTILIVDDERDVIIHLENILRKKNYEVLSTDKGKEAVDLARKIKPDVIILDVLLPDMMGGEVQAELSRQDTTRGIPVIMLSGLNTKEDEEIVKKYGIRKILAKPATAHQILDAIEQALAET